MDNCQGRRQKAIDEEKLDHVARALEGAAELLDNFRNPEKSDWEIEDEKHHSKYIEKQAKREKIDKENAESSIVYIKENMDLVDTLQYAKEGYTTKVQLHLYENLRNDSTDNNSYLISDCNPLKEKFGEDVTSRYEEFLVNYWKCFQDNILLSDGAEKNRTTYATIMALCGIEIENKLNSNWVDRVTAENAISATRLSLCELNIIPPWMSKVYAKFPDEVLSVYIPCIEWSYQDESEQDNTNFVLNKLVSSCDYLHDDIAANLLMLLKTYSISKYQLLKQSIWLLSLSELNNSKLAELAKFKLGELPKNILSYMWWALYIGTEPKNSLPLLEQELASLNCEEATNLAMSVLNCLNDKRGFDILTNRHEYMNVHNLLAMYKLMHKYIREEDDIDRADGGVYSPTARDDAQDARNSLFSALKEITGEESYNALRHIAQMWEDQPWRESWIENMALERAAQDGDLNLMSEKEFSDYSEKVSKKEIHNTSIGNVTNSTVFQNSGELQDVKINNIPSSSNVSIEPNKKLEGAPKDKKSWHETGMGKIILIVIGVVLTAAVTAFLGGSN